MELQVHQHEHLFHPVHRIHDTPDQAVAMTHVAAKSGDLGGRPKTASKQPYGVQLLKPLAVSDVALSAGYVFDVACVDEHDLQTSSFQDLVKRDPINPGRFHGHGGYEAGDEPV